MESPETLIQSLSQFLLSGASVLYSLFRLLLPWLPLAAWVGFWLFAVNWVQMRDVLKRGGWLAVVLIGIVMVLVWGVVAPPQDGTHAVFGLHVSNFVGKTVYVTGLFVIMLMCGSVQLSGFCASCCQFEDETAVESHSHSSGH